MSWRRSVGAKLDAERLCDVAGVDPGLRDAGRGEGARRELARDPPHSFVRIRRVEHRNERVGTGLPPVAHSGRGLATLALDHQRGGVVDRFDGCVGAREVGPPFGESTLGARDRELVRLREVEHDVGDGPAGAARGGEREVGFVATGEQPGELVELVAQRAHDLVHQVAPSPPRSATSWQTHVLPDVSDGVR